MLLPWGERTVLGQVIWTLNSAGLEDILVILGGNHVQVERETLTWKVRSVFNPDFESGEMLSSIQIGLRNLPTTSNYCLVALGDNPQIEKSVIIALLEVGIHEDKGIIVPSCQFRRGHPWLIHRKFWPEILSLRSPQTMRDFFHSNNKFTTYVNVTSNSIHQDLDTPEDYDQQSPGFSLGNHD